MITVIIGPPCAGKTTRAGEVHQDGDVLVDYDAIAAALGAETPWDYAPAVRDAAFSARAAAIRYLLDNGEQLNGQIIHGNPSPAKLARYAEAGVEFELLDPGIDTCLERAAEAGRPAHFADLIRDWYDSPPEIPTTGDEKDKPIMFTKSHNARIKAGPEDGLEEGTFTAYASVFGNVDAYGDVVTAGAFADTLTAWKDSGNPIPLLFGHNMSDPDYNIGHITEAAEDAKGLLVTAALDLESPKAEQVYRLLKGKRVNQMSFAFDVLDAGPVTREKAGSEGTDTETVFELRKLKLHEVSIVPIGANQETEILAVKAIPNLAERYISDRKAGRQLSAKAHDEVRDARDALDRVLAGSTEAEASGGKGTPPERTDESASGKASPSPSVSLTEHEITIREMEED